MKKGFSLLEVLLVLGILAILFGIALPNFSYVQEKKEEMKLEEMASNLLRTRRLALESGQPTTMAFDQEGYKVFKNGQCLFNGEYEGSVSLDARVDKQVVHFTRKGRPDQSAKTISFKGKRKIYQLVIAPVTGQVRWEVLDEKRI